MIIPQSISFGNCGDGPERPRISKLSGPLIDEGLLGGLAAVVYTYGFLAIEKTLMQEVSTPDLSDQFPQVRALELTLVNYGLIKQFGGPVVTIKCHEDNSLVKQAVSEPGQGRVIVVDGGGSLRRALLGDMLAEQAAKNGWAGLVINGVVRDVDEIAKTSLGVQALGHFPMKTEKLGVGQRDVVLYIGGATIAPGDYVYADNNGVIVSKEALLN